MAKKEIIAFANCDGGKIYIGIEDDGTVIGVEDSDSVALHNAFSDMGGETSYHIHDQKKISQGYLAGFPFPVSL